MATDILKTPAIVDNYYVDFGPQLGIGETLSSPVVTALDLTSGLDVSAQMIGTPAPAVSGTQIIFWYKGGRIGRKYVFAVKVNTSTGRTLEEDVDVAVDAEVS